MSGKRKGRTQTPPGKERGAGERTPDAVICRTALAKRTTVAEQMKRSYREFAAHPALMTPEGWISFEELGELANRALDLLAGEGVRFGDRIVLYLENSAILRVLEHTILGEGLVRVALSPRLHPQEVAAIAADCRARVVCCAPEAVQSVRAFLAEAGAEARVLPFSDREGGTTPASLALRPAPLQVRRWPDVKGADPAMLMYSSGTTGRPKGAVVTHAGWAAQAELALAQLPAIGPGDVVLAAAPMTHFGGSIGLDCATVGAATVPMASFEPRAVLSALETFGVTVLPLAPILLRRLLDELASSHSERSPRLRSVPYGGSSIDAGTLAAAAEYFPGVLAQFYGLAEALAPISCLTPADHDAAIRDLQDPSADHEEAMARLRSAGRVVEGMNVRLDEQGQIIVRGDTVMAGYWNREELTRRALDGEGWFSTGDIGVIDSQGYLRIVDRLNDVIISGGFNIYPAEVEQVIEEIPFVREAVVLGAPHERWGEGVYAAVVLEPDAAKEFDGDAGPENLLKALTDACRSRLASYKKPLGVRMVEEIPRNAAGKIDRNRLRESFWTTSLKA